ncbi:PhzF family phenazine biosynthesis protein [Larkinella terrae]|uniref:PhzF family phenazine biosynthesis isomerase n=1 Tax=Larkinella terrae TaxID=2025311 RepID=A0A7K0ESL6_9BACT|nr:PhzF family phenazine biosynthesis protein [Larkinella terrae]MRS64511.1 PhzF family phenazine biosynthesis isomerase [Larkinella terrae]
MTKIPFFQVDAFTDRAFAGNPAGICLFEDQQLTDDQLQAIAAEVNLSETAFLWPADNGYRLRWFTPTVEVALCGHATLASASVLWETGRASRKSPIRFQTLSGELVAHPGSENWIELDFPARFGKSVTLPDGLCQALGIEPVPALFMEDRYLIELATEEQVRNLKPDFKALSPYDHVIVTSRATADSPYDFVSRFFTTRAGIDEDPVTGSAHCCLATYWAEKLGKTEFLAYQASERGGVLKVRLEGNRVRLTGQTVTLIEGTFRIPLN